jgi:hypothetical protein
MEENIHKKEQNGLIFPDLNVQYALYKDNILFFQENEPNSNPI